MKQYLHEVSRKNLVGKVKKQSPNRYSNKTSYRILSNRDIDVEKLFDDDTFRINCPVSKYVCSIQFTGVLYRVKEIILKQHRKNLSKQIFIDALMLSIDTTDVLVNCTCNDFIYRFAFWATKYGYKLGKKEFRPPKKTNSKDNQGAMCKHLTAILSDKRWLLRVAEMLYNYVLSFPEKFLDSTQIDSTNVNIPGYIHKKTFSNTD